MPAIADPPSERRPLTDHEKRRRARFRTAHDKGIADERKGAAYEPPVPIAPCPGTGSNHVPGDYLDGVQTCNHCDVVIDRLRPLDRVRHEP